MGDFFFLIEYYRDNIFHEHAPYTYITYTMAIDTDASGIEFLGFCRGWRGRVMLEHQSRSTQYSAVIFDYQALSNGSGLSDERCQLWHSCGHSVTMYVRVLFWESTLCSRDTEMNWGISLASRRLWSRGREAAKMRKTLQHNRFWVKNGLWRKGPWVEII